MSARLLSVAALCGLVLTPVYAEGPPAALPSAASLQEAAARRFPQPVRAGDLPGRDVLQPVESQDVLGHVERLIRDDAGRTLMVIRLGGLLGLDGRPVAVPLDAVVLLGSAVEVVGYTPAQLSELPSFTATGTVPVAAETVVRIGLARPSH